MWIWNLVGLDADWSPQLDWVVTLSVVEVDEAGPAGAADVRPTTLPFNQGHERHAYAGFLFLDLFLVVPFRAMPHPHSETTNGKLCPQRQHRPPNNGGQGWIGEGVPGSRASAVTLGALKETKSGNPDRPWRQ